MRGYFGVGVEGISKPMNLGNLMRSSHAFGANFFFTVDAERRALAPASDTSRALDHMPLYVWKGTEEMVLPARCELVGIELTDDAIDLPSFRHPTSGRLCAWARARHVVARNAGALPPCGARAHGVLHQRRHRGGDRALRQGTQHGAFRPAPGACGRADGGASPAAAGGQALLARSLAELRRQTGIVTICQIYAAILGEADL